MHRLYLDCETLPDLGVPEDERSESEAAIRARVPKSYKKAETIDKWVAEQMVDADAAWVKTSFQPLRCRVVCIGWAVNDEPVRSLHATYDGCVGDEAACDVAEADLLLRWEARLWDVINIQAPGCTFVAHNGAAFDFPILRLRALKYRRPLLARAMPRDKWGKDCDDTMLMVGMQRGGSLDACAKFFGCDQRKTPDMDGSKVYPLWLEGRHEENAAYCRQDVETLRAVHKALRLEG